MTSKNSLPPVRAPGDTHRHMIVGQNGTGKTVAGMYSLAHRSYDRMPWIVCNYKRDEHLDAIDRVPEIDPNGAIPREPGLYMTRPFPEEGSLDNLLKRAYLRGGKVGFYIDEGTMVGGNSRPLRAVLTQGRSMRIPVIMLSQRPVWLSKYAFTEANFFQAFPLIDEADRKHLRGWIKGLDVNYDETLEEYHSYYFDGGRRRLVKLGPVPSPEESLKIFDARLPRRLRQI